MADIAVRIESAGHRDGGGSREALRRARAFAAASRHSARVRFLRMALAAGAVATVILLVGIALFQPFKTIAGGFSMGGVEIDGARVKMAHPKLSGFRKDGHPYLVTAQEALQDVRHPTMVELHGIDADIALADNNAAHLTANLGTYDSTKDYMEVSDSVRVESPQYTALLKSIGVDFKSGLYVSKEPVTVVTASGATLAADSMIAMDNGKELVFEGHVKTKVPPASAAGEARAELKGDSP